MSVRKRPVITVVDARPMNEVGFRDAKVSPGVAEVPKLSSPPPGNLPPARPPPSVNSGPSASEHHAASAVSRQPVPLQKLTSSNSATNALSSNDHVTQTSNAPPPKPRRTVPQQRPVTIHVDQQNNNVVDKPKPLQKPVPAKRISVHTELMSNESASTESTIGSADANRSYAAESADNRRKTEAVSNRPTVIRIPAFNAKPSVGTGLPPPVAPKNPESKQYAAERAAASEVDSGAAKPTTKPKPVVKPKPEAKLDGEPHFRSDAGVEVRKRPTIIRPASVRGTPASVSASVQGGANQNQADTTERVPLPGLAKPVPTIIRPVSEFRSQQQFPTDQSSRNCQPGEINDKPKSAENFGAVQAAARPNIIRPSTSIKPKDADAESSVRFDREGDMVRFSKNPAQNVSVEEKMSTSPVTPGDVPEKQNAENWKRMEMDEPRSKPPARPSAPPARASMREGQSAKPAPTSERSSNIPEDLDNQQPSKVPQQRGPPPRPATGPTKPTRPAQPSRKELTLPGSPPLLPGRPTLGHPLFHYMVTGPHAIALFEYKSTQPDELSFKAGDVIILEKQINSEWLFGRTSASSGMFPSTFVDIIEPPAAAAAAAATDSAVLPASISGAGFTSSSLAPGVGPRCSARFDYDGEDPADLAFAAGDVIQLLERIRDDWLKGELNGRSGMFPASFVEIIEDLPPTPGTISPVSHTFGQDDNASQFTWDSGNKLGTADSLVDDVPHCIAVYDFAGQNSDDLSFSVGDKITLLSRISDDWLKGELHNRQGIFPASFVRIVKDLDVLPPRPKIVPDEPFTIPEAHAVSTPEVAVTSDPVDLRASSPIQETKLAVAVFDFVGETAQDLSFQAGDVIEITKIVNDEWMEGSIGGHSGIFPTAFVRLSE